MASKRKKQKQNGMFYNIFFPSLSELQYIVVVAITASLFIAGQENFFDTINIIKEVPHVLIFPLILGLVTYAVFKPKLPDELTQLWICLVYYMFLMFTCAVGFTHAAYSTDRDSNIFEIINVLVLVMLFLAAMVRTFLALAAIRIDIPRLNKFILKSYDPQQYSRKALLGTAGLSVALVLVLNSLFINYGIIYVSVLAFIYTNIVLNLITNFISNQNTILSVRKFKR